ncbi:hypothetical protein ACU686_04280 [Yinghuangia aomiensis]
MTSGPSRSTAALMCGDSYTVRTTGNTADIVVRSPRNPAVTANGGKRTMPVHGMRP